MSRLSCFLALGCLLALVFPQAGAAQASAEAQAPTEAQAPPKIGGVEAFSPRHPNNIWKQNAKLIFQDKIPLQALILEEAKRRETAPSKEAEGADKTPPKQPAAAAYVKARHQYKLNPKAMVLSEFIKPMKVDKAEEEELKASFTAGMDAMREAGAQLERKDNVSFAVALMLASAYAVLQGEELAGEKLKTLSQAIDQVLGNAPQMDKIGNAEKQKLVERCFLSLILLLGFYQQAAEAKDTNTVAELKLAAQQLLAPLSMDGKNLKSLIEQMAKE
ncbi:MAG: hypothetical protein FWG75_05105 [Cystobacterineae bacterium]|nr:hypothetical protein [Cystobacterineae bacterium]